MCQYVEKKENLKMAFEGLQSKINVLILSSNETK